MAVYFVRNTENGHIKIGSSGAPLNRLKQLQTASPHPLELIGTIDGGLERERHIQGLFSTFRLTGEWFRGTPVVLDGIAELIRRDSEPSDSNPPESLALWEIHGHEAKDSGGGPVAFHIFTTDEILMPDVKAAYASLPHVRQHGYDLYRIDKVVKLGGFKLLDVETSAFYCSADHPPVNQTGCHIPPWCLAYMLRHIHCLTDQQDWIEQLRRENADLTDRILALTCGEEPDSVGSPDRN